MSAKTPQSSMAAVMSGVMLVIIWLIIILGPIVLIAFGLGLWASLHGGAVDWPIIDILSGDLHPNQIVAALASLIVFLPGIVFIFMQLRSVLATLAKGDPFVPDNAPRLTRIAIALVAMELGSFAVIKLLNTFLNFSQIQANPHFDPNLAAWVSVAALLVLAQVFREGTRLRYEEKMTI